MLNIVLKYIPGHDVTHLNMSQPCIIITKILQEWIFKKTTTVLTNSDVTDRIGMSVCTHVQKHAYMSVCECLLAHL